jgi:hypothetical protein
MIPMKDSRSFIPLRLLALCALAYGCVALADTDQDGLMSALKAKYPITEATADRTQISQPGIVMHIVKNGINAQPWDTMISFDNLIADGALQQHSRWVSLTQATQARLGQTKNLLVLKPGDTVYITKIEPKIESKDEILKISILSCDPLDVDEGASKKRYVATLSFKMPKNSLAESSPGQIEQMVETFLAPDVTDARGSNHRVASAPRSSPRPVAPAHQPPAAAEAAPAQPATQSIALGQTISQVVAVMGQPQQIVDLGAKKTYTYPDLKIVFVNGKVSDVQ